MNTKMNMSSTPLSISSIQDSSSMNVEEFQRVIIQQKFICIYANEVGQLLKLWGKWICRECHDDGHVASALKKLPKDFPYYLGETDKHYWCKWPMNEQQFNALFPTAFDSVDELNVIQTWLTDIRSEMGNLMITSILLDIAARNIQSPENLSSLWFKVKNEINCYVD
jgi:hypothetical protein